MKRVEIAPALWVFFVLGSSALTCCGGSENTALGSADSKIDESPKEAIPPGSDEAQSEDDQGKKPTGQKTKPKGEPQRRCTVADSNGPLPGGERTTSGCLEGETCVCEAQGGYSCSGVCQKGGSIGHLESSSPQREESSVP